MTENIIKKLKQAIDSNMNAERINAYQESIAAFLPDASKLPIFYSLPFQNIVSIIKASEITEPDEYVKVFSTIISKVSAAYPEEAPNLLNFISIPDGNVEQCKRLLSEFNSPGLLGQFKELQSKENELPMRDYQAEIESMKKQIDSQNSLYKELKEQIISLNNELERSKVDVSRYRTDALILQSKLEQQKAEYEKELNSDVFEENERLLNKYRANYLYTKERYDQLCNALTTAKIDIKTLPLSI